MPEIHGHRGARALRPENTLSGLACALAIGVDAIEFDVTLTADGGLILAHDLVVSAQAILDTGPAAGGDPDFPYVGKQWLALTLAQVATLDAGGRRPVEPFGATFEAVPGAGVPTLGQVCQLVTGLGARSVTLAAEMKTNPRWPDADVRRLTECALETLAAHGLTGQARILGFDWRVLRAAQAAEPAVPRVALVEPETWVPGSAWLAGLDPAGYGPQAGGAIGCAAAGRDIGAAWLSPSDVMTSADLLAAAHREGLRTAVWTVNDPARMAELAGLHVDGIVTDRPDLLRQVLGARGDQLPRPCRSRESACEVRRAPEVSLAMLADASNQSNPARAWELRRPATPGNRGRQPAHRPVQVAGLMGYVDPLGVRPGEKLRVHLTAPAAYEIAVARLGRTVLLRPEPDDEADRAEAEWLARLDSPAAGRHDVYPGSYAWVDDVRLGRPRTVSAWVRVWRLPATVETSSWASIVSEMDYPDRCRWALGIDADGHPGCYLGNGGHHDRVWWCFAGASLLRRLGDWVHIAFTVDGQKVRLWVDGDVAGEGTAAGAGPGTPRPAASPVRIGAAAESGVADHFLDGDVSDVALFSRRLSRAEVVALTEDRAMSPVMAVARDAVLAHWPLRERSGSRAADASGHGRDCTLVNTPTLNLPGPPASLAIGRPGYDPDTDPTRGGSIRFASDDLIDCGWPAAAEVTVPEDADSGTYYVRVTLAGAPAEPLEIPFVVVRPAPRRAGSVALLYATFTWAAYARRSTDGVSIPGLMSSAYTRNASGKLYFNLGLRMPLPRAVPYLHRTHLRDATMHQHLVRPERQAEAWLAREGYAYECITDADLDAGPDLLARFSALMIVGHNEYWTQRMRDGVDAYLRGGGGVLSLSGNTAFWRVSYDPEARLIETRKTTHPGEGTGVAWLPPDEWGERWHTDGRPGGKWSYLGQAPSELLGLETLGWIDSGDKTAFAPFTVREPGHFLMLDPVPVPLEGGNLIGTRSHDGPAVSGYEMDGLPQAQGMPALDTKGLTVLAHADHGPRFVAHWGTDPGYGADLIYWERPAGGRVFNAGATNYTGALAVDPGIQALTANVLHHMGVARR